MSIYSLSERHDEQDGAAGQSSLIGPKLLLFFLLALVVTAIACAVLKPQSSSVAGESSSESPSSAPAINSTENRGEATSDPIHRYSAESAAELLRNHLKLTSHASNMGFHVRINSAGNSSLQSVPGIIDGLEREIDLVRSPSHECSDRTAVGLSLPETIMLWNDDDAHVAVLTYCVDSANGRITYNNEASRQLTVITQ